MALLEIRWQPSERELRQFGWLLVLFLLVIAVWLGTKGSDVAMGLAGLAAVVGVVSRFRPGWLRPVYLAWMIAAFPIGFVVSHVILAGVFYLVIVPIGCLLRITGHDPLGTGKSSARTSYWVPKVPTRDAERYFRQY